MPVRAVLVLLTAVALPSCIDGGGGLLAPEPRTWVATEPIQCLGNPWEQDWLRDHGNDYGAYPRDADSQKAIIVEYYALFGVDVARVLSVPKFEVVCLACSCPRGDTLFLLVDRDDEDVMLALGFRKESPGPLD